MILYNKLYRRIANNNEGTAIPGSISIILYLSAKCIVQQQHKKERKKKE